MSLSECVYGRHCKQCVVSLSECVCSRHFKQCVVGLSECVCSHHFKQCVVSLSECVCSRHCKQCSWYACQPTVTFTLYCCIVCQFVIIMYVCVTLFCSCHCSSTNCSCRCCLSWHHHPSDHCFCYDCDHLGGSSLLQQAVS